MSPDALRTETSHEANNEGTNDGNKNFKHTRSIASRRNKGCTPALKEKEVGEKPNKPEQNQRNERTYSTNPECK